MALIDDVKQICDRLAPHGWRELLLQHGLDMAAENLERELSKPLRNINRRIKGFEDFAFEGLRAIEPGSPARSLLFHAFASPNVVMGADGNELTEFPTLAELDTVENYLYGVQAPSIVELRVRAKYAPLAIAVFASEYRPAAETPHRKHADVCFSRTGVARVGTAEPLYNAKNRGFLPFVDNNQKAFRVIPARYSAYIAVIRRGNQFGYRPMRFREGDDRRLFWFPLHKLFDGTECIRDRDLSVTLEANHINEKLRRIHLELQRNGFDTGWGEPDISNPPFVFTEGIAEWAENPEYGTGVLVPIAHPRLVEPAEYQGNPLTFKVPENYGMTLSSSLLIPADNEARHAPEYVHARHQILANGDRQDLNERPDVVQQVANGGYNALHYLDFTADGAIEALCPELAVELPRRVPAYSLVSAPDYFPTCDQRQLMDWWEQSVPETLQESIWRVPPETLSDERMPPNLALQNVDFRANDVTVTAIVSLPTEGFVRQMQLDRSGSSRQSHLTDAAAGIYAPGWDVSFDRTPDGVDYLAAYGLGSPFPEDSKLCAALSTFWPAVSPDAARTFEPAPSWPTVSPLTDAEIGQVGNLPWDGVVGPQLVCENGTSFVEYSAIDHVDYVKNALNSEFTVALTGQVDVREYESRVLMMAYVYRALGIKDEAYFRPGMSLEEQGEAFGRIISDKAQWSVLSFREASRTEEELQTAQSTTGIRLTGQIYRFEVYRHGSVSTPADDFRKRRVEVLERVTLFVNGLRVLLQRGDGSWQVERV